MRPAAFILLALLLVVGLPVAGRLLRGPRDDRCALRGLRISPLHRVRVRQDDGTRAFCCVACARAWLARTPPPLAVLVTDEATGEEFDAREATFVVTSVVTNPVTGNRVHVFRDRARALEHLDRYAGRLLDAEDRPLP